MSNNELHNDDLARSVPVALRAPGSIVDDHAPEHWTAREWNAACEIAKTAQREAIEAAARRMEGACQWQGDSPYHNPPCMSCVRGLQIRALLPDPKGGDDD